MRSRNQIQTVREAAILSLATLILYHPAMALQAPGYSLAPVPPKMQASDTARLSSAVQQAGRVQQPGEEAAKSVVIVGVIDMSGSDFTLRDSNGNIYRLDARDKVAPFAGKYVKVTGTLEETAKLLHVDTIEEVDA